ncbi:TcaA NTF2-like domain-containing protein [Amphibacillus indicireducens]|uniref:Zinc ribbon domain-containing protein n=1 Tax=Amphibacillus indicireducens TaxID=1076330 RepID=A0ABP7VIH9_9BACI
MKFCNQCGKEIKENAKFCRNCGQQFDKTVVKVANKQPDRTVSQRKRLTFKERPLKQRIRFSVLVSIGIILIISYFTLSYLWSADRLTKQLQTAIVEGDYLKIAEMIEFNNGNQAIGEENAQVLLKTINDGDLLEELLTHFNLQVDKRTSSTHDILNLKQTSYFLGFRRFKIIAEPYYISVRTNLNNTQISHMGQQGITIESNDVIKKIGPFVYGEHNFSATYENEYVSLELSEYLYLSYSPRELDFYFDVATIWVPEGVTLNNSKVLLNGNETDEEIIIGESSIGPIDPELDYKVEIITTFPWGELSTGETDVLHDAQDNYFHYQLSEIMIDDLLGNLTSFYDQLFSAYRKNDLSQLSFLESDFYSDLEYTIDDLHHSINNEELIYFQDLTSFGISDDFLHVYYDEDTGFYNVIVNVIEEAAEEYQWYSDYLKDPYYDADYYQYHFAYQNDQWNVLYRTNDYRYDDERSNYRSLDYSGDSIQLGTVKERVESSQDENELIASVTVNYIDYMVEAINAGDYSLVEPYIKSGSLLEDMQIGLVERLVEAGTTQEVIYREVIDIEQDGDQWFAYTDETIKINFESGDQESRDYNWKYTVVKDGNNFKLTNIERE